MSIFKTKEIKRIVFDNVAGIFDYPKNIRVPNVGEYIWFDAWKQGYVHSVDNRLEDGFLVTTIRVSEAKVLLCAGRLLTDKLN